MRDYCYYVSYEQLNVYYEQMTTYIQPAWKQLYQHSN